MSPKLEKMGVGVEGGAEVREGVSAKLSNCLFGQVKGGLHRQVGRSVDSGCLAI